MHGAELGGGFAPASAREGKTSAILRGLQQLHARAELSFQQQGDADCVCTRLHDRMPVVLRTPEDSRLWLEDRELSSKCASLRPSLPPQQAAAPGLEGSIPWEGSRCLFPGLHSSAELMPFVSTDTACIRESSPICCAV